MSLWPIVEVRPSRSLPPLECCPGVRSTHAAKSRPFVKVSVGGAKVLIAAAVTAPTPGTCAIGDWITFYNHRRPHQALAMRTPAEAFGSAA